MKRMAALLLAAGLVLASCKEDGGSGGENYAGWKTSVTKTTCVQWEDQMTSAQREAMSRELVQRLDAKDTSDSFASDFAKDITKACEPRVDTVRDIAAGIATLDTDDFH